MITPELLLERMDAIGHSLAATGQGVALIGLGSVGEQIERLDAYSDLDFFAVVQPGTKEQFLADLAWLAAPCPLAYRFRNTPDGYKLLYEDGIFAEMAVFEPDELATIPFTPGRLVWHAEGVDPTIRLPALPIPTPGQASEEWLLGEALTCLYVGLQRYHRGEQLSAQRFIQHHALDKVLALWEQKEVAHSAAPDPFVIERRIEQRHPSLGQHLPHFAQGYTRSRESAYALLCFIDAHWSVHPTMRERIATLCQPK